ncbi:multidrug resistance protein [Astrocystis sublimbata]|nr:multidrug resistance protein [Astrocystis sublimbata]
MAPNETVPHEPFDLSYETLELEEHSPNNSSKEGLSHGERSACKVSPDTKSPTLQVSQLSLGATSEPGEKVDDPFQRIPEHEAAKLRIQIVTPKANSGITALYRYASQNDIIIMIVSALAAIGAGAALPLATIIFGNIQNSFQGFSLGRTSPSEFIDQVNSLILRFVYLAVAVFGTTYVGTVGFIYTGEHISAKIRQQYLQSCVRQNIGFFDKLGAGEVTTRITDDMNLVQEGISERLSVTLSSFAAFLSAFIIGFVYNWKLTLILTSVIVGLFLVVAVATSFVVIYTKQSIEAYASGGTIVEEAISSIRNSVAFGTGPRLAEHYDQYLKRAESFSYRVSSSVAMMFAGIMLVIYLNYGLGFWVGIMLAIVVGAFNLGNVAPNLQAFGTAVAACENIFSTIDRYSPLDPLSNEGKTLDYVKGTIRLQNIKHIYPSRPDVVVLDNFTLDIPSGKTTALVGTSGSGKSTIVGLVERFYTPVSGQIFLDGHDIGALNLRWLRRQVSLVSQEPVLFDTTIFNNILYGLPEYNSECVDSYEELVIKAAKKANAHDFISTLKDGYQTNVGERGFLLSGGQKQRIAIARAIISDPKILLLDEATSALDTASEEIVQAALEAAAEGRTTITIAHRLSTIKDADNIVSRPKVSKLKDRDQRENSQPGEYINDAVTPSCLSGASYHESHASSDSAILKRFSQLSTSSPISRGSSSENLDTQSACQSHRLANCAVTSLDPHDSAGEGHPDGTPPKSNQLPTSSQNSNADPQHRQFPYKGTEEKEVKHGLWTLVKFVASFNKQEWKIMLWGLFWAIVCGGGNPVHAFIFAKQVLILSVPITSENRYAIKDHSDFWSLMYLVLALVIFLAQIGQGFAFAKCSAILVHKVRDQAFRAMLRQEVTFFDENTTGALASFLSTEATHVAGLSGATLGTILTATTTLVSSIIVALVFGWKLALVCTATVPVIIACGFFRFYMLAHFQKRSKKVYARSASYASEAISNIRTVASLTREADVLKHYQSILSEQQKSSLKAVAKSSLLYAASQSVLLLAFALGFWYGSMLIARREYDLFNFFVCFVAVIYGAQSAGSVFSFAPDMGKTYQAASKLKTLFDRKSSIDTSSQDGKDRVQAIEGAIELRDVHFHYPTRPDPVLSHVNLSVHPNQYIALVGPSGSGKSTTISLLERFYDPTAGAIYVDGKDIRTLNLNDYRSFLALVSQEPTLYQGTIKANILLGTLKEVSDKDVESACRKAHIYDFIVSLPDGFDTIVGTKGVLLSGGQKQRIAIARALVRDPRILLLDEATSALDSESESVVQAALENASRGRTTIAVAHRLSTIKRADIIYVFDQGQIVEHGSHAGLMKQNGRYAELVRRQGLEDHS